MVSVDNSRNLMVKKEIKIEEKLVRTVHYHIPVEVICLRR